MWSTDGVLANNPGLTFHGRTTGRLTVARGHLRILYSLLGRLRSAIVGGALPHSPSKLLGFATPH